MKISVTKYQFSIINQKKTNQFYFQINYSFKYFFHGLFTIKLNGGATAWRSVQYLPEWKESHTVGLFFDATILNVRLGVYLHPIIYKTFK